MTGTPVWVGEAGPDDAPLIVLVHGTMDRSSGMLKLSRLLDSQCRVARYDRRGYGRSLAHAGPFGMGEQVADLVQVIAGRPAVLIGHSYGGNVALATAERHPDLVRAVGIYETPLSWMPWWPGSTAGSAALAEAQAPEDAAEHFMRRMVGDARWEALPERTRLTRRLEGAAMVGELSDLRASCASGIVTRPVPQPSSSTCPSTAPVMRCQNDRSRRPSVCAFSQS